MNLIQFLIFELFRECNLAGQHPACPTTDERRYQFLDMRQELNDEVVFDLACRVYREHGFRGLIGWHYYNEPTVQYARVISLMKRIKAAEPRAGFVLWTNGVLLQPELPDLELFNQIYVSNYFARDFNWIRQRVTHASIMKPSFDQRRQIVSKPSRQSCVRPYTEMIIDAYGNVHICCVDWQGKASPGNIFTTPFPVLVERFAEIRDRVADVPEMSLDAPQACLECHRRWDHIDTFLPEIHRDAAASRNHEAIVARRTARNCATVLGVPEIRVPFEQMVPRAKVVVPSDTDIQRQWDREHKGWRWVRPVVSGLPPESCGADFPLYALLSSWYEADIIEAAVKNCLNQGFDRVYLVDNDSPDGTREKAVAAGAILARNFHTDFYQDNLRVMILNEVIREIVEKEKHSELWFACLDADEMPRAPGALTVREFLASLPRDCRTVGAIAFDHYPTERPANIPGFHPAEFQPCGMLRTGADGVFCPQKHWKHSLIRYHHGVFDAAFGRGLHNHIVSPRYVPLIEPHRTILLHHVTFREEADTRRRLAILCAPSSGLGGHHRSAPDDKYIRGEGAVKRYRSLDYVYTQQWDKIELPHAQAWKRQVVGVSVVHWSKCFTAQDYAPCRWYTEEDLASAISRYRLEHPPCPNS